MRTQLRPSKWLETEVRSKVYDKLRELISEGKFDDLVTILEVTGAVQSQQLRGYDLKSAVGLDTCIRVYLSKVIWVKKSKWSDAKEKVEDYVALDIYDNFDRFDEEDKWVSEWN